MGFKMGNKEGVKFGDGQSTKLGGRKKGKAVTTIIKELLSKNASQFSKNKDYAKLKGNEALAVELIAIAFNKDNSANEKLSAIKEILDRTEGKAVQTNIVEDKKPVFNFFDARDKKD